MQKMDLQNCKETEELMGLPANYKRVILFVYNRLIEELKQLFRNDITTYEIEDILKLLYSTKFKINKMGRELTFTLKEDADD